MLNYNILSLCIIPILFAIIHFLEFSSYYCRVAGLKTGIKVLSYSYQQMFFVGTRFFFMALMPLIGLIVDNKIPTHTYNYMLHISMLLTSIFYIISFLFKENITRYIIDKLVANTNSVDSIVKFNKLSFYELFKYKKIIILSCIVFCSYSLGVFLAFYYALIYYEYRSTIGQLSGIINGLATILLTFVIEPLLAKEIDNNNPNAINMIFALLFGRFIGVGIMSHFVIIFI